MSKRTVVNVEFPESATTNPKAILLTADDSTESVIEKINTKLRVDNGTGLVSIKPNNGEEIPCNPGDNPYDIWAKYGANNAVIWFRPRELEGTQVTAWDDFDDFGFGSMRMMEGNETSDQFDELLSQLKFDELQPVEGENMYGEEQDTENLPLCSSCGGPIVGKVLMAFSMPWHPEHLGCAVCGNPFTGGRRVMEGEDGNAYCEKDFIETFAVKCGKCGDPVIGDCVNALGVGYHPEHFTCATCKEGLVGAFFEHEGDVYCEKHYYQKINLLCPDCEKPIYKKCVNANGIRYHVDHFKCTFCKKNLAGMAFFMHKGKQYCKEDSLKLFG